MIYIHEIFAYLKIMILITVVIHTMYTNVTAPNKYFVNVAFASIGKHFLPLLSCGAGRVRVPLGGAAAS